jgi:hypothetical protein
MRMPDKDYAIMNDYSVSALITDGGEKVHLRLEGRIYQLTLSELRQVLDLPEGPSGLGITVDRGRFQFEFADNQSVALTTGQLRRRLARKVATGV